VPRIPTPALLLLPLLSLATIAFADAGVPHSSDEDVPNQGSTTSIGDSWVYGSQSENGNQFRFAVLSAGAHASMSLSDLDFVDELDRLQKEADRNGVGVFWFSLDGESYRVTDPDLVKEAQDIVKPMADAGRKQGEWGAKMGEVGAQMGELGALQGRMGALRAQIALHRIGDADAKGDLDQLERELDEIQAEFRDLRAEQRAQSDKMRDLGKEQKKAGKKTKEEMKRAQNGLRDLARRAIAEVKATRDR
jgi:hypothetical protein